MRNSFNIKTLVLVSFYLISNQIFAATSTANLTVTATVSNNCTISTSTLAFGNYDPIGTNSSSALTGKGQVTITCTKGATPTITLGPGQNGPGTGTTRRMSDGNGNYLNYELYQPTTNAVNATCNYTGAVVWGTTGTNIFTPTAAPSKAPRTYNVCGQIPAGQDVSGSFTDTVVATVNF